MVYYFFVLIKYHSPKNLKCCKNLGLPNPTILNFSENDILLEQKNNKPCGNKFINLGRQHSDATKLKMSRNRGKIYNLKSPSGEIITVENLTKFCKNNNIQYTWLITQFKRGNSCKGWTKI